MHKSIKKIITYILLGGLCLFLTACGSRDIKSSEEKNMIYYLSREENGLECEDYKEDKYGAASVDSYIKALSDIPDNADSKRILGGAVLIVSYELVEDCLRINYNDAYFELDKKQEILFRASMTKTLCQLPEVSSVAFWVEGEPLSDMKGEVYGSFVSEDFVDFNSDI